MLGSIKLSLKRREFSVKYTTLQIFEPFSNSNPNSRSRRDPPAIEDSRLLFQQSKILLLFSRYRHEARSTKRRDLINNPKYRQKSLAVGSFRYLFLAGHLRGPRHPN